MIPNVKSATLIVNNTNKAAVTVEIAELTKEVRGLKHYLENAPRNLAGGDPTLTARCLNEASVKLHWAEQDLHNLTVALRQAEAS
jgi:hypothetical protein